MVYRYMLVMVLLLFMTPAMAAQDAVIYDGLVGPYYVVAQVGPTPLTVGLVDLQITITDPQTGEPQAVPAVYVTITSEKLGISEQFLAPPLGVRANGVFDAYRLHFPVSGNWTVAIQILDDAQIYEQQTQIYVRPVLSRIMEAACIAVPATLFVFALAFVGYRLWLKRRKAL